MIESFEMGIVMISIYNGLFVMSRETKYSPYLPGYGSLESSPGKLQSSVDYGG